MLKISEFSDAIGATERDINNWVARLSLRTTYADTIAGSARRFSRENVLEMALINAYKRAGIEPQTGVALSDMTLRADRARATIREWVVFAAGNSQGHLTDDLGEISFEALTTDRNPDAPVVCVVRVGEVVRRVNKLFAEE